jgi:hypothetical protein
LTNQKFIPKPTLRWSKVGEEVIILDSEWGELLRLNPVAGFIWKELSSGQSPAEIAEAISQEFEKDRDSVEKDLETFLKKMKNLELLESQAP